MYSDAPVPLARPRIPRRAARPGRAGCRWDVRRAASDGRCEQDLGARRGLPAGAARARPSRRRQVRPLGGRRGREPRDAVGHDAHGRRLAEPRQRRDAAEHADRGGLRDPRLAGNPDSRRQRRSVHELPSRRSVRIRLEPGARGPRHRDRRRPVPRHPPVGPGHPRRVPARVRRGRVRASEQSFPALRRLRRTDRRHGAAARAEPVDREQLLRRVRGRRLLLAVRRGRDQRQDSGTTPPRKG